ncbi:DsbA family protein [Klugiella xanthotipulae]|uniref:Protein-disulfide isomerase n=1 Tax=Klugiella xanthotipulae TaxID=244735 RepID=A0A543HT83_9MICO|nr:thioredoxin domain-containing protein [Klugiella xanthotipulae]TQM61567.1 protein-disulfide isomerase [Klugiella xanthotipulae]
MSQRSPRRRLLLWGVPAAIVAVAAVLVVLGVDTAAEPEATAPTSAAGEGNVAAIPDLMRRTEGDPLALGALDAPLGIVVYSDYQCGYCALWSDAALPTIMSRYVDTGQVRIEFRDMQFFGDGSTYGALAAYAAGKQGKLSEYHAALFPGGEKRAPGLMNEASLIALADELGLDVQKFTADISSEEAKQALAVNKYEAELLGVTSTPSFLVGEQALQGNQPVEVFETVIDAALAEKAAAK